MTKFLTCLLAIAMMAGLASAQITDIDDIQEYDAAGAPASPYDGQTVTIEGTIFVVGGTYNGGTHYVLDATGGVSFYQSGTGLVLGDQVSITGTVGDWSGEIQISSPSITYIGPGTVPEAIPMSTGEVLSTYENVGSLVAATGFVTEVDGSEFRLASAGEDTLICYIDSDTGIDYSGIAVGDEYLVRGPVVNYNGLIEIKPRMQSDLVEDPSGDTVPVIENGSVDNYVVMPSATPTISATITDNSAVTDAMVYYRNSDGENPGAWMSVAMANQGGDLYAATLPGGFTGSQIDYYYSATDDGGQTVTQPASAPDGVYELAVGMTSIYDVQYVHPDSANGDGAYNGKVINVSGVVTAGTGEVGAPSKIIIQEPEHGPYGGYAYGALLVYEGTAQGEYYQGDLVEIGGYGNEYFGLSQILPHNGDAINLVGFGNDLPTPERVNTRILADDTLEDGDSRFGEAYECVWVKSWPSAVVDTLGYGEYIISDTEARADSVEVDPAIELTYVPTIGDLVTVEGYMDYDFGDYQITPVADQFVSLIGQVAVEDLPTVVKAGGFESIYPNPFNPSTTIKFVLNRDELTQLNIYNLRGELVRTLVNAEMPMGTYDLTWDGKNADNESVASGQYFARLRIGSEVTQVRKLSLVK